MSTTTTSATAIHVAGHGKTVFWRFVWKEFRMNRSLWAAVAIMGLLVQCVERMLLPYSSEFPLTLLYTALSAAVLYAVGAAATTFSVEHEEETYDFLIRLPTTWWPLFASKLLVTLGSALLLAVMLMLSSRMFRGPENIGTQDASRAVAMMGFAIIEAVAWGTLFSLLIKRPLLAAVVALVVGGVTINVAVSYAARHIAASLTPEAYLQAIPLRVTIVAAVFACCVLAARGWLTMGARSAISARLLSNDRIAILLTGIFGRTRRAEAVPIGASRRRLLVRLLWQTWRECWKVLAAPLGVTALLFAGMGAAFGLFQIFGDEVVSFAMSSTVLFAPALYGAMAFYADQRRGNYRFLAEHAARPRYTWLARHIVWLGALVITWTLVVGTLAALILSRIQQHGMQQLMFYFEGGAQPNGSPDLYDLGFGLEMIIRVVSAASFGALVAYGVGQLFSMAVRSEILAAFLALLLTLVVAALVFAICLWQLSAVWFLIPLFVGLMLATWLRAPDWIATRNSWRAWLKPALAIVASLVLIAVWLPGTRLAQLRRKELIGRDHIAAQADRDRNFAERLATFQAGDTRAAAQTADMYTRLAARMWAGSGIDLLQRWRKPEYLETDTTAPPGGGEIDEAKIPPNQRAEFKKAQKQQADSTREFYATIVDKAIEISNRPTCRFHFDPSVLAPIPPNQRNANAFPPYPVDNGPYRKLKELIGLVAGESMSTPDQPARRFLAAMKMEKHLRDGQPTTVVIELLKAEQITLHRIDEWSQDSSRTKEELREVLDKLSIEFHSADSPVESLLADHLLIRTIIDGNTTPYILSTTPIAPHAHLAYLANQLWWERQRAHLALDRITRRNIDDMNDLTINLSETTPRELGVSRLRRWLRPDYGGLPESWTIEEPAAVTSYLVSLEYKERVPISRLNRAYCDNEVCRRATLLGLALSLYRLDHKKYPPQLVDLVPDYLNHLPLDAYSRQPFQYQPAGLNLPLAFWSIVGESQHIEPGTPLFWSVGAGDVKLKQLPFALRRESDEPLPPGEEAPLQKPVPQYEFIYDEPGWWNTNTLAFPLKK